MDMTGEYRIPATRDKVWAALNDPAVLKASLPGCESLERTADNQFAATVVAKVGPVKAKFNGQVELTNINAPESYTIVGEGKGGAAGFAKGNAEVRLAEDGAETTVLNYTAKADVGGKLAQLGSRLIDGTARKIADQFFANFAAQVTGEAPPAQAPVAGAAAPAAEASAAAAETEAPAAGAPGEAPAAAPAGHPAPAPSEAPAAERRDGGLGEMLQSPFVLLAAAIVVLMIIVMLFR